MTRDDKIIIIIVIIIIIIINYLKITGIMNNMLRPQKTLKKKRIKLYSTPALPGVLYGSEN